MKNIIIIGAGMTGLGTAWKLSDNGYQVNVLEIIDLQNVLYYQFKLENPEDYRILWNGNLTINASKGISFHMNTHYRFDKSGDSYFEISNGFGFQF